MMREDSLRDDVVWREREWVFFFLFGVVVVVVVAAWLVDEQAA